MTILDQWQDRWNFTAYNTEQRFQTQLVTKRRFFNALLNIPLSYVHQRKLQPDFDTFNAIATSAYKFADDVFLGANMGQMVRSYAFAYGKNKEFRDAHSAARALEGFSMAAELHDDAPQSLSQEIQQGRSGVVNDLIIHSTEASEMLDQFVHGTLPISPTNIAKLERQLHALAKVCDEKAELKQAYSQMRTQPPAEGVSECPTDYIRDVMDAETITTARQAQILSGFVSAVLVEAARPLGTEIYVPQDELYLKPEYAVAITQFMEKQLEGRSLVANLALNPSESRPLPDVPQGALIKAKRDKDGNVIGHEPISKEESLAFANNIHSKVRELLGPEVNAMLSYADKHFDKVENAISRSQENPIPEGLAIWGAESEQAKADNPYQWQDAVKPNVLESLDRTIRTSVRHITRPEARHENQKLFGRAVAAQIVSYPVKILDEALKSFLRPGKGYDMLKNAAKNGEARGELIDRKELRQNFSANTFKTLTAPFAASFGTVLTQEMYHLPRGMAIEAAGRAGKVLNGAIMAGHHHAPNVAARAAQADIRQHPAFTAILQDPVYREALTRIAKTPDEERTEDDLRLLGKYYRELGDVCVSVAEETLSPFGVTVSPERIDSIDEIVTRTLRKPVENVPDAMVSLAFVQSFLEISTRRHSMMEYIDPRETLISHDSMKELGNFIDQQAKAAELRVAKGDEGEAIQPGQLLQKGENGQLVPAESETLIRFANAVTHELKRHVDLDVLMKASRGEFKEKYLASVEEAVFANPFGVKGVEDTQKVNGLKQPEQVDEALTQEWQGKVKRSKPGLLANIKANMRHPEVQHEVRKLRDRSKGESISAFFPGMVHNSLQHKVDISHRSGWISGIYKTFAYPIAYSIGIVAGKESINELFSRRRHIINESDISQGLLEAAVTTAGISDDELKQQLTESNQINEALLQLEEKPEYKDIPRISAKPRGERTAEDDALMERFCNDIGRTMMDQTTSIFASLGEGYQGESMDAVMERVLEQPVDNLKDAVVGIGLLHSIINQNAAHLDVLTFVRPESKVLDRKELKELTEYMNDQAKLGGFAIHGVPVEGASGGEFTILGEGDGLREGELLQWNDKAEIYERAEPEAIIRFANLATAKFRHLAQEHLQQDGAMSMAERYSRDTKNEIFTRL